MHLRQRGRLLADCKGFKGTHLYRLLVLDLQEGRVFKQRGAFHLQYLLLGQRLWRGFLLFLCNLVLASELLETARHYFHWLDRLYTRV